MSLKSADVSKIARCNQCSRLRDHCRAVVAGKVLKRSSYTGETYWGKPVPNFEAKTSGLARLLIVGLAPSAHGGNRTGRMFTGDDSGLWLYRALHRFGFAKTSGYQTADDNTLIDCSITAAVHCAPPGNKPNRDEHEACLPFLVNSIARANPELILALGSVAWDWTFHALRAHGLDAKRKQKFGHGARAEVQLNTLPKLKTVIASYHPSRQNTNTGVLTEAMFDSVFRQVRRELA